MDFTEYLWSLILGVMKKVKNTESDVYKLLNSFGNILEDAKESIFVVRRQGIITTAKGRALDLHGEGRKVIRYAGESDDQYRKRILSKKELARMGGTKKGIINTAISLGYGRAELVPMYIYDKEKWSEFYLFIDKELMNELNNFEILKKEIANVKKAGSYPLYVFTYYRELQIKNDIEYGTSTQRYVCGKLKCGQTYGSSVGRVINSAVSIKREVALGISNINQCATIISGSDTKLQYMGYVEVDALNIKTDILNGISDIELCGTFRSDSENNFTNDFREYNSGIRLSETIISAESTTKKCSKTLKSGVM